MKRNKIYTFLLASLFVVSCTDNFPEASLGDRNGIGSVKVYVKNFMEEPDTTENGKLSTRTTIENSDADADGTYSCEWVQTDKIGIFPYGGTEQVSVSFKEDTETESNHSWSDYNSWFGMQFESLGWTIIPGQNYVAYYPYSSNLKDYKDRTFSYTGQIQRGNDNTSHLANYDYLVSNLASGKKISDEQNTINFYFDHVGSRLKLNLYGLPENCSLRTVYMSSPTQQLYEGKYPAGFHTSAPISFAWDEANPDNRNVSMLNDQASFDRYWTSSTSTLSMSLRSESGSTTGFSPVDVPLDNPYHDYGKMATVNMMVPPTLFCHEGEIRDDALYVRVYLYDNTAKKYMYYSAVLRESQFDSGYTYVRDVVLKKEDISPATSGIVDLGLPSGTLWDACNVGANRPEQSGVYVAWGETESKDSYAWNNYSFGNSKNALTKYITNGDYGTVDNLDVLLSADDVATRNNEKRFLPTKEQIRELIFNCTWSEEVYNGVIGAYVVGPNGNSIFLPYSGCKVDRVTQEQSRYGYYWSKSLDGFASKGTSENTAGMLRICEDGTRNNYNMDRYVGCTVRAVRGKLDYGIADDENDNLYVDFGLPSGTLWAKYPIGVTSIKNYWNDAKYYVFGETKACGEYDYTNINNYNYNKRFCNCENDEDNYIINPGITCVHMTRSMPTLKHVYVDWENPHESTESVPYGWLRTYAPNTGEYFYYYLKKYSSADQKKTLDLEDDAAHINWGGDWRVPSLEQYNELIKYVPYQVVDTKNGNPRYTVFTKNGQSIYIFSTWLRDIDHFEPNRAYPYYVKTTSWNSVVDLYLKTQDVDWELNIHPVLSPRE